MLSNVTLINHSDYDDNYFVDSLTNLMASFTWWYVIIMAAFGVASNACAAIYLATRRFSSTVIPCMIGVVVADCLFLTAVLSGLGIGKMFPNLSGALICKLMSFVTHTTSLFSNWCWVVLWGGRYLAVFHPWVYYRYKFYKKHTLILFTLLLICIFFELWTLLFVTEVGEECDIDESLANIVTFKYLILAETCIAYFLPFTLILYADVRVFTRHTDLKQMAPSDLCPTSQAHKHMNIANMEQMMVVSDKYKKNSLASKHRMIRRFVALASIDLLFNFPNVILNLIHVFQHGADESEKYFAHSTVGYAIKAGSYAMFYLQFVLNVVYIKLLIMNYVKENGSGYRTPISGKSHYNVFGIPSVTIRGTNTPTNVQTDKAILYSAELQRTLSSRSRCGSQSSEYKSVTFNNANI